MQKVRAADTCRLYEAAPAKDQDNMVGTAATLSAARAGGLEIAVWTATLASRAGWKFREYR